MTFKRMAGSFVLVATLGLFGLPSAFAQAQKTLRVLVCPLPIPPFTVKQYWYARYHHDAASRWLRGVCAELFMDTR